MFFLLRFLAYEAGGKAMAYPTAVLPGQIPYVVSGNTSAVLSSLPLRTSAFLLPLSVCQPAPLPPPSLVLLSYIHTHTLHSI